MEVVYGVRMENLLFLTVSNVIWILVFYNFLNNFYNRQILICNFNVFFSSGHTVRLVGALGSGSTES